MKELLEAPDRRTPRGRVEHALLLFFYNTGARVSETTQLVAGDLQIGRRGGGQALVNIHGKGGKHRQCPLWPRTEAALTELLQGRAAGDAVFLSRQRRSYTRFGVYRLVERSAARVPLLAGRRITPHTIRHTSACHLLQAGIDLNTIRAGLGHASLDTTNIYAEIDMEMKARAMALCDAAESGSDRPWRANTPDYSWDMLIRASNPAFSCGRSPVSLEPLSIRLNRLKNRTIEPLINHFPARGTVTRRQVDSPVRNPHRFGPFHGPDASFVPYPGAQDTRASLFHNRFQSVAP